MIVMKFGGTSVGSADSIRAVSDIVKSQISRKPVVVVSAITKVTDALIKLANECAEGKGEETLNSIKKIHQSVMQQLGISNSMLDDDLNQLSSLAAESKGRKVDAKLMDLFQSFGERMSSKIVSGQLSKTGVKSKAFNSWELGLVTDCNFGDAEPLKIAYSNLKKSIAKLEIVPVVTGFIGKTGKGEVTTLGRGGSDYTSSIIGAAIDAEEIQIWKDVNGIMTTDPKIVKNARTIEKVSFAEASELAYFGAKVLHPKTILPAMKKNIPVRVLNSFNPENKGTIILSKSERTNDAVKAIACKKDIKVLHISSTRMLDTYGFLAKIFSIIGKHRIVVDVITTSEISISMTIGSSPSLGYAVKELGKIADVQLREGKAVICVVGEGISYTRGIAGKVFSALSKNGINVEMISQVASEINITFIVDGKDADNAVIALHKEYFG